MNRRGFLGSLVLGAALAGTRLGLVAPVLAEESLSTQGWPVGYITGADYYDDILREHYAPALAASMDHATTLFTRIPRLDVEVVGKALVMPIRRLNVPR